MNSLKTDRTISEIIPALTEKKEPCLIYESRISAGFPSPSEDYTGKKLDLNEYLIRHPSSTFFVRVSGESMMGAGIQDGDILIVDRSLDLEDGKVIIAILNGELTVKRYREISGKKFLVPENVKFSPIEINEKHPFELWGVVTNVIHKV